MQDKIILVNAGCGYDGKVKIREDDVDITQLVDQVWGWKFKFTV